MSATQSTYQFDLVAAMAVASSVGGKYLSTLDYRGSSTGVGLPYCDPHGAVPTIAEEIDSLCADSSNFEENEPLPSEKAISELKAIIAEAEEKQVEPLLRGDLTPYFGELSITWRNGRRMLRLTTFSDGRSPRLDFGTTPDGALGEYSFDDKATADSLLVQVNSLMAIRAGC